MTNPISKAIVKAAVAMGYGKKSDYKGSSVADVLEKFASIAKDKGGSGGYDPYVVEVDAQSMTTDADFATAKTKFLANEPVLFRAAMAYGTVIITRADTCGIIDDVTEIIAAPFGEDILQFKSNGTIAIM